MRRKIIYSLFLLIFCLLSKKNIAQANELTFSVSPIIPENQIDKKVGYYNLLLDNGKTQDLTIRVENTSNDKISIKTNIVSAKTNSNGVVDYNNRKIKKDLTLKYNIEDIAKTPKIITLNKGESKDIKIHLTMPSERFNGLISGGINFKDISTEQKTDIKHKDSVSINNTYSFQLGLLIRNDTTPISEYSKQKNGLKLTNVKPSQSNFRNVIDINFQNPLPNYLNQLAVKARIYRHGKKNILYEKNSKLMQMAPNSNFNYSILLGNGEKMIPGKYTMEAEAYSELSPTGKYKAKFKQEHFENYKYRWKFNKDFITTRKSAVKFNNSDVTINK
ncbi:DUF916 and DUF3324 domain-containing protein, partial [Latilactobacillus fragifolii]|uniref:DUF916 and DUF3324 domain-containing protein n=1 Tax=Latilactobacillus fragifolii TaxID=2814244 RepID=UPI001ABB0DC9